MIKKIIKKVSGIMLILTAIAIWLIHTYDMENASVLASSTVLSRNKDWVGSKKSRKPCTARPSEKQI